MASGIGLNLSSNVDWQTGRYWLDLKNVLRVWQKPGRTWDPHPGPFSPDGYPLSDFDGFAALSNYPSGMYHWSFHGSGKLYWTGGVTPTGSGGTRQGSITINGDSGHLSFKVTGVDPSDPLRNLSIRRAGGPAGTFDPDFVKSLKPYTVLRFMDWQATNFPTTTGWDDTPMPKHQQTDPGKGVALEHIAELCRLTGGGAWVCVPHTFGPDDVEAMASVFCKDLPKTCPIYLEYSNEPWNGIFPAYKALKEQAAADKDLDHTNPHGRLYQLVAKRLWQAVTAFQKYRPDVVGVLAGQAVNPWLVEQGLDWIDRRHGRINVRRVVGAVAYADYFLGDLHWDGDLEESAGKGLNESLEWVRDYRALADKYGVKRVCVYEGGQHLTGTDPGKRGAQTAPLMGTIYRDAIDQFFREAGPDALWCAFASPSAWKEPHGYWGLSEGLGKRTPKLDAVEEAGLDLKQEQDEEPDLPPVPPVVPPPSPPTVTQTIAVKLNGSVAYTYTGPKAAVEVTVTEQGGANG